MSTRKQNERKFGNWMLLADGGRRYWYDVERDDGFTVRYVKVVDADETTTAVVQELYDAAGKLAKFTKNFLSIAGTAKRKECTL